MDAYAQERRDDKRSTTISAAVTVEERDALYAAVRAEKVSVSEAIRQRIAPLIERGRILLERERSAAGID